MLKIMPTHQDAVAMAETLEEISDRNLIHHYTPELIRIGEGQRATTLLPDSVIQNFIRMGLIVSWKVPGGHSLTEKARDLLRT